LRFPHPTTIMNHARLPSPPASNCGRRVAWRISIPERVPAKGNPRESPRTDAWNSVEWCVSLADFF
jgi:hypothetical protein